MENLDQALKLLQSGQIDQARIYLEELLRQEPENADLLYNLGLCYIDLDQLDKGTELLRRCLMRVPKHSHACVALGIACQKKGDISQAKEYALRALQADSRNPVAFKNLGAIFGQEGDNLKALYYLRRSFDIEPQDPQTVYGLAFACLKLGDTEPAQKYFEKVLEMEAQESLHVLAKSGLREIASREFKAKGPRVDAVFYLLGALRLFRGKSLDEVREIAFEIGMLGQNGLDINDPNETHVLRSLPGRVFSALELVCIMYAGFKRVEPGMDIGVDLGEEWGMAERLAGCDDYGT
ncbi:MAG: tetratricopeptide repeat protein [Methanothrix sp.]|nr:tetratricopeptide repeat protein [Methanothrix sp.]MDD4446897.1 tetratricopeptide repeat protein [Methanothrix sp.]